MNVEIPQDLPINTGLALRLGASFCTHPFEYSKVLIQLGHEPLAPRDTKTLFGKPALAYPSVFQYVGHIRRKDGFTGLWRGVTPKICSLALQHFAQQKFNEYYPAEEELEPEGEAALTEEQKKERFVKTILRDIASKITCVVVSQPLQVLAIRSMAKFVGGDSKFSGGLSGIYNGFLSVLHENGILGFWSGLVPRLLGEVGVLGITSGITFLVNTYLLDDKELTQYTGHIAGFLAGSFCYPMQVVSTCMTVSRSGLVAGYPPRMPLYTGWMDCLKHLWAQGQLKRGSSLIFRYYTGPQVIVNGRVIPASASMFRSPLKQ